jgi:putative peptide-modifying radical SAM enzyme
MFFHVILTTDCNSECRYCFGEACEDVDEDCSGFNIDYSLPRKMSYDIETLDRFCRQDEDCVLTFYGGEPLLCTDDVKRIMDSVKARWFMIQTNGLLFDRLQPEYVNRLHTILVSVDGNEKLTDHYRGEGTFRKVINNLKLIKQNGFRGELIARMTVMEQTDIYKQVKWLLNNEGFPITSVHWQLNAGFWKTDFARRDFIRWSRQNYTVGIHKLARFWVDTMEQNAVILRLYPLLGIAKSLLSREEKNLMRCGGGWINYAIQTDGFIVPCPTMWGMKDYYLGHISTANPLRLEKVFVKEPCTRCDDFNLCGGRCLYANVMKRWGSKEYGYVCETVHSLIEAVSEQLPRMQTLIDEGRIKLKDFDYVKYNGCEIIP